MGCGQWARVSGGNRPTLAGLANLHKHMHTHTCIQQSTQAPISYQYSFGQLARKIEALLMEQLYLGLSEVERYATPLRSQLDKAGLLAKFRQI